MFRFNGNIPIGIRRGRFSFDERSSFLELREQLDQIANDNRIDGVVIDTDSIRTGLARGGDIIDLVVKLRESGKQVIAFSKMSSLPQYLIAAESNEIVLNPAARLYTFGLRFEQYFLKRAFEKFGVSAQFVHLGAYKAAANRFVRESSSPGQSAMMESLHATLTTHIVQKIADRRSSGNTDDAEKLLTNAPHDPRSAALLGFSDSEAFFDDIPTALTTGDSFTHTSEPEQHFTEKHLDYQPPPSYRWKPVLKRLKRVAVIDLTGMIVMPGQRVPGASSVIDPDEVIPLIKSLEKNPRVQGLLVHINSPGGSALASDMIWRAIDNFRKVKPTVAYCTDVAASGGYYIAVGCDTIVCRPETITGSIGVVAGKMSVGGVARQLGVDVDVVGDDSTSMLSMFEPMSPESIENFANDARTFYRRFLERVGQSRSVSKRRLHRYARGRVYTGQQAFDRGLVDYLGGFDLALKTLSDEVEKNGHNLTPQPAYCSHEKRDWRSSIRRSLFSTASKVVDQELTDAIVLQQLFKNERVLAYSPVRVENIR